jgi:HD-like signal output (HDOD) protein
MQRVESRQAVTSIENLVRVVLLQDGKGKGQIVLANDSLLDLKALNSLVERNLIPIPQSEIAELTAKKKLVQIEFAPAFFMLPTIIDENIASAEFFHIEIFDVDGVEIEKIELAELRASLRESSYRVRAINCAIPAEKLYQGSPNDSADLDLIFNSIRNFTTLRIKQRLEETLEIPPLPQTAHRILALRSNPNANVGDLAEIVEMDASLAAQIVSWASSPYYAAPSKIRSVQDAISRVLGFELVSNLAVGMALGNTLSLPKDFPDGFTPYWLQSVYCSTVIEAIVKLIPAEKRPSQGLACLAGLLHNFGYLVLAHIFPPHFSAICRHVEANPAISHVAIDHHLLGVTREQISAWLLQLWNMPKEVCAGIRFQHEPDYQGENCVYANLILIAMRELRQHGIGDAPPEAVPIAIYQRFDLNPIEVMEVVQKIVAADEELKQIAANFKN